MDIIKNNLNSDIKENIMDDIMEEIKNGIKNKIKENIKKYIKCVIKGELQCKTTLCGVKEGQKLGFSPVLVFLIDPLFKRK